MAWLVSVLLERAASGQGLTWIGYSRGSARPNLTQQPTCILVFPWCNCSLSQALVVNGPNGLDDRSTIGHLSTLFNDKSTRLLR